MNIYNSELLTGQVAVVTGASRGIGRAIAVELAKAGADVAILDLCSPEAAAEAVAAVTELGRKAISYSCNVGESDQVKATIAKVLEDFGRIDILVNNAGITRDGLIMQLTDENFNDVINTNLRGAFNMIRAVSRTMIRQRSGRICSISSVSGLMGNAGQTNYSASKAGIIGLTKSAALELSKRGITVNAVAPGFVDTSMTKDLAGRDAMLEHIPLGRIGKPEEIAAMVVFLCSPAAAYITGEVVRVDGGMAM
ncbi:MAG: 3-oxoacyl-[acyl-carrier-protein] reductase [Eubacteriales bacterium]